MMSQVCVFGPFIQAETSAEFPAGIQMGYTEVGSEVSHTENLGYSFAFCKIAKKKKAFQICFLL